MMQLQPEMFLEWAGKVSRLKMFPYFTIADYAVMCMVVRDDMTSGANAFSRKHPLATWFSSMMMCFAGSFLANLLLGEPVITPFKRQDEIMYATIVWYFVFYSPMDICYRFGKFFPVNTVLLLMKEIYRAFKIQAGVLHAAKVFPNAYLVMILIGTAKGAGAGIVRTFEQLVRGVWAPGQNEMLRPTFYTKACLLVSALFVLEKKSAYLAGYPHEIIFFTAVAFFVYFKLNAIFFHIHDPFAPFENLFCALFMGGIWDALSRAIQASRDRRAAAAAAVEGEVKKDQ